MIEARVRPGEGPCVGIGTIAISRGIAEELNVREGEPLLLKGKKTTVGVIECIEEMGGNVVYLGRMVAMNVQAEGTIEIEKIKEEKVAEKVILAVQDEEGNVDADDLKRRMKGLYACEGDQVILPLMSMGRQPVGLVLKTVPEGVVQIGEDTEIVVKKTLSEIASAKANFSSIGGFKEVLNSIIDMELRLINQSILEEYGSGPIKGVIIHGPSGVGKTLLLKSLANEARVNCILAGASELAGLSQGEAERRVKEIFGEAKQNPPSIICIDDLDSICAKKGDYSPPEEKRILTVLLGLLDNLSPESRIMVIATSRNIEDIDQSLRRSGRFDKEVEISLPNVEERKEILEIYASRFRLESELEIPRIAELTHGYSGADLELLCKDALWNCVKRNYEHIGSDMKIKSDGLEDLRVSESDFIRASRDINPSLGRQVIADIPKVAWDDVGGCRDVKSQIEKDVIFLWKNRPLAKKYGVELPKGILLYGDPGTGKTYLAKAIATAVNSKVINVRASSLLSKWFGEYERNIARIFEVARKTAPVVLIIDEVDSIAAKRGGGLGEASRALDSGLNVLLQQIDGVEQSQDVFLICITNRPDVLDEAFTRKGRIGKHIYVGRPDPEARKEIFRVHLRIEGAKLADDVDLDELSKLTEGSVGADIKEITRNSLSEAFFEFVSNKAQGEFAVCRRHFISAIRSIQQGDKK